MVASIGSWRDSNLQMKCAREAVKLIENILIMIYHLTKKLL